MRRLLPWVLCAVFAGPDGANRQPLRARHGMVVAMEAIAADVNLRALQAARVQPDRAAAG